jgi:ethanolaminephosphotransferase
MTRQKKEQHFRYLTPNGAKNILHYKYRGSDASLYYKHVISPAAQWLVDHVIGPSIAPNTITISGLGLVFLSHVALLMYVFIFYICIFDIHLSFFLFQILTKYGR